MDHLWSPWRYRYISEGVSEPGCVFCRIAEDRARDEENLVVSRGRHNFIVLNLYPYANGHCLIVPYAHRATLEGTEAETVQEMAVLTQRVEAALRKIYKPDGINIGMNIGRAAGAGVAEHIHMHALPRWFADSNFATVVGETRVLPEELNMTWKRLREALAV